MPRQSIAFMIMPLLLVALGLRLATFERHLPHIDTNEESIMYLLTRAVRGVEEVPYIPKWLAGYPPGYVWISTVVQEIMERIWSRPWIVPSETIYVMRLVAVFAGVITTGLIASIGWQVGGAVAGWFAGLVWAISPIIISDNNRAFPDPIVYLTTAATLAATIRAWRLRSPVWLTLALASALASIYTKYPTVVVLIPWGITALYLIYNKRRVMLPWLVFYGASLGMAGIYLLFVYGASGLSNSEADSFRDSGLANMLSMERNVNNFEYIIQPLGDLWFYPVVITGILAYAVSRQQGWKKVDITWVAILALFCLSGLVLISAFIEVDFEHIRHTIPLFISMVAIWAAALTQVVFTLTAGLQKLKTDVQPRWATGTVAITASALFAFPAIQTNLELIQVFRLPDTRYLLWHWADINAPLDGMILMTSNGDLAETWNRPYSGYDGQKPFAWWHEGYDLIRFSTPTHYAERNVDYFTHSERERQEMLADPQLAEFLNQLVLMKVIRATPENVGNTLYFYRMLPPQYEADSLFGGEIRLVGYDLSTTVATPDNSITFRPYWRRAAPPTDNYSMFIHLRPTTDVMPITQFDGAPASPERLVLTWDDPDELYIGDEITLLIPEETPPGEYELAIGLYRFASGERLLTTDAVDSYTIPLTIAE